MWNKAKWSSGHADYVFLGCDDGGLNGNTRLNWLVIATSNVGLQEGFVDFAFWQLALA
jgi:hypothetical protein